MATITLTDLVKSYDDTQVLHHVEGAFEDGEFIVIVGPSGCGKSTLLRMVAGLESVTSGEIRIGDRVVNDLEPADRDIAMVFQNYALYPHMSVFDNMAYGLKIRRIPKDEIRKLQKRLGVTSIYVTHDQVEAMTLSDRLMVLNGGYVEQFGAPIELYERPASIFVAGTIGSPSMNFFEVTIAEAVVTLPSGAKMSSSTTYSGKATLGIRPEHMSPAPDGPLKIEVGMLEQLGANTLVHGVLEGRSEEIVASLPGLEHINVGTTLGFDAPSESIHLFDETGVRID